MTWGTDLAGNRNVRIVFAVPVLSLFLFYSFAFAQTPALTPNAPSLPAVADSVQEDVRPGSFSFVVFGDCHVGRGPETDAVFRRMVEKLEREKNVDFAVNLGDFADHGKKSAYDKYFEMISTLGMKIYHVPGNHDLSGEGYKYYKKKAGGSYYYSFDQGDSHFIILNNAYGHSFDARQFAWLKKELAENGGKHIFVFMHRPTFDPGEIFGGYVMSGRERVKALLELFKRYRVDYVFAGHIHAYSSSRRNGTNYIVSGGGGGPLHLPRDFGGFHHYLKIHVEADRIFDKIVRFNE